MANATAALAFEYAKQYAGVREAFGKTLAGFQVTRHKLVDMATKIDVSRQYAYRVAARMRAGVDQVTEVSMAKVFATRVCDEVTWEAVQIHGGYGYMREYPVERLYRDGRILSLGGGTTEIMKEIIAKRIL
jgi:acyl-CoA dehydrogenase